MRRFSEQQIGIATALVAAVFLAGCGGIGGASATDDLSEAEKSRIAEDYRDCMAEAGLEGEVNFDNGGLDISVGIPEGVSDEEALEIERECESLLEPAASGLEMDPEDEARLIDASADLEKCITAKGYVVTMDGGGISLDSADQAEGFDDAQYLQDEDDCYREVVPDLYEKYGEDN